MIPKNLIFFWLIDKYEKPKYVDFSIEAYKTLNPTFNIMFLEDNIHQPNTSIIKELTGQLTK